MSNGEQEQRIMITTPEAEAMSDEDKWLPIWLRQYAGIAERDGLHISAGNLRLAAARIEQLAKERDEWKAQYEQVWDAAHKWQTEACALAAMVASAPAKGE
jgi:hypothetical protein